MMARGQSKLCKDQRIANKACCSVGKEAGKSGSIDNERTPVDVKLMGSLVLNEIINMGGIFGPAEERAENATRVNSESHLGGDELCRHHGVSAEQMERVSALFSELFTASFRLCVPRIFHRTIQCMQELFVRDKILALMEEDVGPAQIPIVAKSPKTQQSIRVQLETVCETELAKAVAVLRFSLNDSFDLACALAERHGRNLHILGPPCACYFAHCIGCLETVVEGARSTGPPKHTPLKTGQNTFSARRLTIFV